MPDPCACCGAAEPLFSAAQYMRPSELRMCEACVDLALRARVEALATNKQEKRDAELGHVEHEFDAPIYYEYASVGPSARDCPPPGSVCSSLWSDATADSDVTEPAPPPGFKHNSKTRRKMRRALAFSA